MTIVLVLFFSMLAFTGGYYAGRNDEKPDQFIALPPEKIEVIKYVQLPPPVKTLLQEIEDVRQKLKYSNLTVDEASMAKAKLEPMLKHVTAIKYNQPGEEI
jgi:hypothetical protein